MAARLHVVAAVLRDPEGRVLLTQRLPHQHHAGRWEFPGGKVESGESPAAALAREIDEELGVSVDASEPLHVVPWDDGDRRLRLDAHVATRWRGTPRGRDGQAIAWVAPSALHEWPMPPADEPIASALRLAREIAITPDLPDTDDAAFDAALARTIDAGVRQVVLRLPRLDAERRAARTRAAIARCRAVGVTALVHDDAALATRLDADGVHLSSRSLRELATRPLPRARLVGAAGHDALELRAAQGGGCDYAMLSPVAATASHPDARPIGWSEFATLARDCALPVFALGGVSPPDRDLARAHGAFGVAGIRAFWRG